MANDTHANILLNLLIREYGCLPDEYRIVGFDDSPIASEAIVPITTIEQQIDKIAYEAMNLLVSQMNERKKENLRLKQKSFIIDIVFVQPFQCFHAGTAFAVN